MSQRTKAGLLAVCLLAALWGVAVFTALPYVTYSPGPTVDLLSTTDGKEKIQVTGHKAYYDDGQLRLTTVYVDDPQESVNLLELMRTYVDPDSAVYPRSAVYAPDETDETNQRESTVQMVSSQDSAVATALTELGYDITTAVEVLNVGGGLPADGKLEVRDVLVKIGDTVITDAQDVVDAVDAAPVGEPLDFVVRRDGARKRVAVTPREIDGDKRVGITPGPGYTFPFDVTVDIGDGIGGPSAGLMMSLAVYDTLTPGSLTSGHTIAGTGTVTQDGKVGPIGGIQQKIAASREAGVELFLVPADNCDEVLDVDHGDMRLARATTMHDAIQSIEAWVEDPKASLPSCEEQAS